LKVFEEWRRIRYPAEQALCPPGAHMLVECERVGPQTQLRAGLRERLWLDAPLTSGGQRGCGSDIRDGSSWCPDSVQHGAGRCPFDSQHIQTGDVVDVHDGPVVSAVADRPGDTVLSGSFDKQPDGSAAVPVDPAGADDDRAHLTAAVARTVFSRTGRQALKGIGLGRVSSSAIIPPVSPRTVRPLVYTKALPVPASARRNEPAASMSTSPGALAAPSRAAWITASALRAPAARLPASASEPLCGTTWAACSLRALFAERARPVTLCPVAVSSRAIAPPR
jgi:hypothetical protein